MTELDRLEQLKKLTPAQRAFLAQALRERKAAATSAGAAGTAGTVGIPRRAGPAPLSSGQRRMWLAQQLDPASPAANLPAALRLDGALDVRALAAALTEIARRHEVLRTGIVAPEGEPLPIVMPPGPLPLPIVDLAGLRLAAAEEESLRLAAAEARWPFDLARPPALRAQLARLASDSHLLLLTLHHVAADAWSLAILVREMSELYGAFAAGLPSPLPELPIQYADYAAWQQDRLVAGELAVDLAYWRQRLAGLPPQELPRSGRPADSADRAAGASRILPQGLIDRLRELARQERGTLFMAFAAAFSAFLGRLAEQQDVAFAIPVAARTRMETEGLIGFFVNTLVLRADLGDRPTFRQLLAQLRTTVAAANDHQELPFERLVEELAPDRRPGRHPLVRTLFSFQNVAPESVSLPGLTATWVEVETGVHLFDLGLEVTPYDGTLAADLELAGPQGGAPAASHLLLQLEALLAAAVADPDVAVEELPFLAPAEWRQILESADPAGPPPAAQGSPDDETVERVAALWAEVLGLPRVGAHDSFWQLGGHSLLAARVAARVRQAFDVDLPLRVFFEASTPAELAAAIRAKGGAPGGDVTPVSRLDRDGPLPLSFGQQRLWFLHQLAPDSPAYNVPFAARMEGPLHAPALAAALTEIVRRHEVLRTAIVTRRGEASQEVTPALDLPLPVADLSALPVSRREEEARRLAAAEARRPFDLTRPPLLRVLLVRSGQDAHRLVFNLHHVAGDGWSGAVLVRELGALYPACAAGRPSPLPELPLQYADYARWQRAGLAGPALDRLLAYWRQHLDGLPPLVLPTDRPRPPVAGFRGAHRDRRLSARLSVGLERLAGSHGATLFMALATGFAAFLGRLAGQEDFGLAVPVAGRTRTELEGLIGFFVNTLVLRVELSGETSFSGVLARMRETALAAFSHQDLPFERLVEELGARRDPARQPLAQALIVFQNTPQEPLELPGLTLTAEPVDSGTAKLDLTLHLGADAEGLVAGLEVDLDLFDPATAARMLEQLAALLAAAVADPGRPISELPMLSAMARHQVVAEWGGYDACDLTPTPLLKERGLGKPSPLSFRRGARGEVGGGFEAIVHRQPDAIAVTDDQGLSLTYRELDRRANRLARHLRALGVGPEVRVGVCLPRTPELVIALLAVVKAGGAYLPLDPDYPRERLGFLLADSRAPVVVTVSALAGSIGEGPRKVLLDADAAAIARRSPGALTAGAGPDHPLYVIYTSGSTGQPKGVVVTHRNVERLFAATEPWFDFGAGDVWTLFHSFAFDFSVWEIWGALLYGGRLVVVPYWVSRAPDVFLELLRREGATVLNQTPSAFRQLIPVACRDGRNGRDGRDGAADLPLRFVVFGGEALDPRHLAPWIARFGDDRPRLVNMYGITETTVHVTYRPVSRDDAAVARSPIGRAIPDLSIRLLDRNSQPVPIGVQGEICVGGPGVARGYLGRPGLTAERFVPDPFATVPGVRLYRSGDLARWLADGDLEVLGRIDVQVKVRGFRVEVGEIEAALSALPGVHQAVVVAQSDGADRSDRSVRSTGEQRLVAYVTGNATAAQMRRSLRDRLPGHLVPAAFVTLAAFPLTRHGKLDREALPAPDRTAVAEAPFVSPETPVERTLAASWAEVLDLPRVGLDDDFFALGGDSIRAIQVRARAEERGALFTLQELFRFPTIRDLARTVRAASPAPSASAPAAGDLLSADDRARLPNGIEDAFPLARNLAGLVFHSELSPDYLIYLTSFHLQLPFDAARLQEALDRTVARHPVLRSSYAREGFSEPLHLIHRQVAVPLEVEDLRHLTPAEQDEVFGRWFAAEQRRKLDWRRPPLLRLRVHWRGEESFQITLSEPFLDGWSVGLFYSELFHRYLLLLPAGALPAAATLPPPDDEPLAATYRDYVALERAALASAEHRRYWERRMDGGGAGHLPAGPFARRRAPGAEETPVGRVEVPVPAAVSDGLWAASRAAAAPLKDLLLAVHCKVLSFLTGSSDVVSGVLANGRPEGIDGDRIIGGFLNAMPFRIDLAPGSWLDLARQMFDAERELLEYRRFPLSELQQRQPEIGRPLFDTLFNFTHFHVYDRLARLPGLTVLGSWGTEQTYFPLTVQFNVREISHRVSLSFDHPRAGLDSAEVAAIGGRYARVLEALAAAPQAPHDALCLLNAAERQQVVAEWNDTTGALAADRARAVHERVWAWAARAPAAPAIRWEGEVVTYGELVARAGRVARRLLGLGLPAEARVGILLERSPDLVAAILGTVAAGAAYVPLDPAYPRERLEAMLEDSGACALVTRRGPSPPRPSSPILPPTDRERREKSSILAQAPSLPADGGEAGREGVGGVRARIDLEDLAALAPAALADLPCVHPAQLFAVIYTSGSTGRPKGVAVAHRSVAAFLAGAAAVYPPAPPAERTGMLAGASVCFDLSVFELFFPLSHGGAAVLAGSALDLPRLPARDHVRLAAFVPSTGAELMRSGGIPSGVRTLVLGGEALPPGLARELLADSAGRRLFNAYGPTEATIYALLARIDDAESGAPPIGLPAPGSRAYLLDAGLQPVLAGVEGEIWLGGPGLARGYLGRPELTADRFRPDPFASGGERLYRTGDLGRRRPDGRIEFLGRRDQQVKVRGFRIELGDVEAALARHPGLETAVVVDRRDAGSPGEARLVAYAVPRPGLPAAGPWAAELRGFLQRLLPAYMIPAAFVVLDALPLTATGKVDRRALPSPDVQPAGPCRPWVAPRTPVEEVLCAIWAQVFGLPRVGADGDFFELGGHSLLATRLISRLRESFALELPLRLLFEAPVLADLAREVERALREGVGTAAPPLAPPPLAPQPRPSAGVPLSFAQQRLWFLDRLEPASPFYNLPLAVRLRGRLQPAALAAAFAGIVGRHEALRTRFPQEDGRPVQVVVDQMPVPLPVLDLAGLPGQDREAEAARLAGSAARRPFDLARGPLLRLALLQLQDEEHLLLAVCHHVVADGWSMGVLLGETAALYGAFAAGEPSPLPPLAVQYPDFALWQRSWLTGETLAGQLAWWRERLADVPPLELPTDRPRPVTPAYRGARCPFALPPAVAGEVRGLARSEGATLFMALLAGFVAVLGRWADQEVFAVGTPIAGRTRSELEPLIGFFVNTLALRADLGGDLTGRDLLRRCRESALGAYAHQDMPFEKLVEELKPERELARSPLFQVLLSLQNTPLPAFELPGLTLEPVAVEPGTAKLDLTLSVAEAGDGIAGWLEHDLHLFDPATAARLAGHLAAALQALAADPGRQISALPFISGVERHQLIVEWAAGPSMPDEEAGVEEWIAAQARRTPGALAVTQGEVEMTYRDLLARADDLARSLRARGVGPETVVAIHLPKSPAAIVAMLAVLRAGGAYLPLDPAYPEERLAWLREDARVALTVDSSLFVSPPPTVQTRPYPNLGQAPAYVLYTSGSTGRPKGVVVTRAGLLASTRARLAGYAPPVSAFLLVPSLAFDSSVVGLYWALCQGGTLVLPTAGEAGDPARLAGLIAKRRVSHWLSIPALWSLTLDAAGPEPLGSLAAVMVAGENCPADLPRRHAAALPGVPLLNEYGPTEATVWATAGELHAGERITIGRPIAGARAILLDGDLRPAPAGVPSPLFLGGAGLARGYFGRPDLTAERFVPDPLGDAGDRLYRTGDLARWLPDGRLELLGRADDQVKIRGFRIEPGEIEAALERCPGVRQAAVVVRELAAGDRRLAGCVAGDGDLDLEALRRDLAGRLPAHMVPAELAAFAALPVSPNGKVDRAALRTLLAARAAGPRGGRPPAGELERRLAALWEELLEIRDVRRDDGFFALGGHSLLAVELVARIERDFGRRLPLAALFRGSTLASLAAAIRAAGGAKVAPPVVLLQEGRGRPSFWFHALDGSALLYADLARRLPGLPLYGLEADGNGTAGGRLADLAVRYAEAVVRAQPRGPYLLGGWSFGGLVAWETARRLRELDREVGLLALLDSRPPDPGAEPPSPDESLLGGLDVQRRDAVRAHLQALRGYRPQPLDCPVALFLAADRPPGETSDRAALWRPLARGGLDVETVPGDHFHLLSGPGVDALAAKLRGRLAANDADPA